MCDEDRCPLRADYTTGDDGSRHALVPTGQLRWQIKGTSIILQQQWQDATTGRTVWHSVPIEFIVDHPSDSDFHSGVQCDEDL